MIKICQGAKKNKEMTHNQDNNHKMILAEMVQLASHQKATGEALNCLEKWFTQEKQGWSGKKRGDTRKQQERDQGRVIEFGDSIR